MAIIDPEGIGRVIGGQRAGGRRRWTGQARLPGRQGAGRRGPGEREHPEGQGEHARGGGPQLASARMAGETGPIW
jgi:hypothetical protein